MDSSDKRPTFIRGALQLRSQTVDVNVEGIFFYIGVVPPTGFDKLLPGGDKTTTLHQEIQQFELLSCEGNIFSMAGCETAAWVERDVPNADDDWLRLGDSSCDRADACQQDLEDEGLYEVVVGAEIKRMQNLGDGVDCGEDQYGGLAVLRTNSV